MGVKLERIVKTYYDNLEEGKITGRKCKDCGATEFPPVLACNTCGSTEMEWIEISGNAKMTSIILPNPISARAENSDLLPYCFSAVELEEGAGVNGIVRGVTRKNKAEIEANLPVDVQAEISQRDGFKTVVFVLKEK